MSCAQTEEVPALEWESDTNFLLETFQLPLLPKEQRETVARWMTCEPSHRFASHLEKV